MSETDRPNPTSAYQLRGHLRDDHGDDQGAAPAGSSSTAWLPDPDPTVTLDQLEPDEEVEE